MKWGNTREIIDFSTYCNLLLQGGPSSGPIIGAPFKVSIIIIIYHHHHHHHKDHLNHYSHPYILVISIHILHGNYKEKSC